MKNYLKYPLCVIHWLLYICSNQSTKSLIDSDIVEMNIRMGYKEKGLFYWLSFHKPYRNLFYFRIKKARFLRYILPPYQLFTISVTESFGGKAFVLNHPFSTIINARSIGSNFTCCHLTTIGNGKHGRNDLVPRIGNNVSLGANVTIIGDISIGDNVIVGAGSVVVKDVPSNTIVVGNPARVINNNVTI